MAHKKKMKGKFDMFKKEGKEDEKSMDRSKRKRGRKGTRK